MVVAVRKEPNGSIYIDKNLRDEIDYTKSPYNFKIVEIGDVYNDCLGIDFNEDLTFSVDKYMVRKQRAQAINKISNLKQKLKDTDYQAIKHFEGCLTDYEYEPIKTQRQAWRDEINELEKLI